MTAMLSILVGIEITDAMLTSCTASEPGPGETAWSAATNYTVGTEVLRATTHRIYENLIAGTDAGLPENTPLRWFDKGPSNRWSALDGITSTQTVAASPYTTVLHPGHFNAAYYDGLEAEAITITVKDAPGGNVVFTYTGALEGSAPSDYYEYFYDPFRPLRKFLASSIEPYLDAEITVTFTSSTGTVKCGVQRVGDLRPLGQTLSGVEAKPKSYSRIVIDDDGDNTIKYGKRAKDLSCTALVSIEEATSVLDTLTDLLDIPCVVIASSSPDYSGTWAYGLVSATLTYSSTPDNQNLSLSVNGLI